MAKRAKKALVKNVTKQQFEEHLGEYATADARRAALTSKMDEAMTKIREKYADQLTTLNEKCDDHFEVVQVYCTENHDSLFTKKKSMETVHGLVGFRTGTPKLKTLKGFTWAAVLEMLKIKMPDYVRVKEEPNKELLLVNRDQAEVKMNLDKIGLEVDQDENFFIELKKEDTEV